MLALAIIVAIILSLTGYLRPIVTQTLLILYGITILLICFGHLPTWIFLWPFFR